MSPRVRKSIFDVLRIAICAAALYIVLRGVTVRDYVILSDGSVLVGRAELLADGVAVTPVDGTRRVYPASVIAKNPQGDLRVQFGLATAIRDSRKALLVLAVLLHAPVGLLQALRLQWLLWAQRIVLSYWQCVKLSYAGNFLNFATPLGSNAGDVFKAYFVTTHTRHKTEAATTIVIDRAIGLGTLLVCVALITLVATDDARLATVRPYVLTMLLIGVASALMYLSPPFRRYVTASPWLMRWRFFSYVQRIDQTIRALTGRLWIVAGAVLITVALQVLAIGAYFVVAIALRLQADLGNMLEYFAYFYSGAVVQALPGPPQGLGTVELTYRYFLGAYGSPSQILCLALVARMVVLICAMPGLWVTATGSYRPTSVERPGALSPSASGTRTTCASNTIQSTEHVR